MILRLQINELVCAAMAGYSSDVLYIAKQGRLHQINPIQSNTKYILRLHCPCTQNI